MTGYPIGTRVTGARHRLKWDTFPEGETVTGEVKDYWTTVSTGTRVALVQSDRGLPRFVDTDTMKKVVAGSWYVGQRVTGVSAYDGRVYTGTIEWESEPVRIGEPVVRVKTSGSYVTLLVRTLTDDTPQPDPPSTRERVLDEAKKLITGDRNKSYGSPVQNFTNTAELWTTQFRHLLKDGVEFEASHVAQAMVLLKMARMVAGAKEDNWIDVAGYAGCGAQCDAAEQSE